MKTNVDTPKPDHIEAFVPEGIPTPEISGVHLDMETISRIPGTMKIFVMDMVMQGQIRVVEPPRMRVPAYLLKGVKFDH
jgi:hypothetical protein